MKLLSPKFISFHCSLFIQTANALLFSGQLEDDIDQFKNMLGKLHNDLSE